MIKLCGFAASNYYAAVKFALLEKGAAFEEVKCFPGQIDKALSPIGKVPFLDLGNGVGLSESDLILDYLEETLPSPALYPSDAIGKAKVRELCRFLNLHIELVARRLYQEAFFGGTISDALKATTQKELTRNVAALLKMAKFSPFIAGSELTAADCLAFAHFPLLSSATKKIYGADILEGTPAKAYLQMIGERSAAQTTKASIKAGQADFAVYLASFKK